MLPAAPFRSPNCPPLLVPAPLSWLDSCLFPSDPPSDVPSQIGHHRTARERGRRRVKGGRGPVRTPETERSIEAHGASFEGFFEKLSRLGRLSVDPWSGKASVGRERSSTDGPQTDGRPPLDLTRCEEDQDSGGREWHLSDHGVSRHLSRVSNGGGRCDLPV